ncbi:MAG: ABC transporter substrate-binding protein [Bdellovibrionales bacterium]
MFKYTILFLIFLSGCKTMELKEEALQASDSYRNEVLRAQKISKDNPNLAISNLNNLLSTYPENNLSDDALLLMGDLLQKTGNSDGALKSYSRILDSKYSSPLDGKALLRKTKLLSKQGDNKAALKTLDYVKYHKLIDQSSLEEVEVLRAPLLIKNARYSDYLYSAKNIITKTKNKTLAQDTYKQAQDVLQIKMTGGETKKILEDPSLRIFHPQAALNLTAYYFENNSPELAISNLETYSHLLEAPEYKSRRDELMIRGHVYTSPNKDVIGVIIPLSGKYKFVGQQVLKGLQYSFNLWEASSKTKFKLAVLDSEGDPNQVSLAFDELMKNDKPIAIIGGLVGKTAEVLLQKSKEYKVPSLILSQKEGLTDASKYGFQSSQSLETYTDLIASIAIETMDIKKVAILHSKKSFSNRYAEAFEKSFTKKGGEIVKTVEYDISERRALPNAVKSLVGLLTPEGREEEYKAALKIWKRSSRSRGKTASPKLEEILKPQVDFDALFVADGAKNGGLIASTLAYFDVEDLKLLGTHLWNDTDLLERGQRFVENSVFASSYFEPQILSSKCGQDFQNKFQEPINAYIFRGIELGVILNSIYGYFDISSRGSLLTALKRTSIITHKCLPQGLVRDDHNFSSPLMPLTVKDKSIVLMSTVEEENTESKEL